MTDDRQDRVNAWVRSTFGDAVASDIPERALRAVEEILELAQAVKLDVATIHRLVDYVFSRPLVNLRKRSPGAW